ncbi:MAG: head GIN domain-containing protein [bacterium]
MKKYVYILAIALISLSITACMDIDYVSADYDKGNGDIETFNISAVDFSTIDVRCSGKVFIEKGDVEKVEVKIDRNLYSNLDIYVKDGELVVDLNNATPTVFEVYITTPNIYKLQSFGSADISMNGKFEIADNFVLDMDGSGDVYIKDIIVKGINVYLYGSGDLKMYGYCENADLELDGSGNCEFLGKADTADIEVFGSGDLDMRNIENKSAIANLDGSGDLRIQTSNTLNLKINGSGNAYLYNHPEIISSDINGSGKLIYMR